MSHVDALDRLIGEYNSRPEEAARLERSIAFGALQDMAERLFGSPGPAALSTTTFIDGAEREYLLIRHRARKGRPLALRLLMNEGDLAMEDMTKYVVTGTELVALPTRGLIAKRVCRMLEREDGEFDIGNEGFLLNPPDDTGKVVVRHGLGYRPGFPTDSPSTEQAALTARGQLAREMTSLLSGMVHEEALGVDYLFMPQLHA
ncbi:MAG TPA: hypothetical protein VFH39_02355 [Candidatus Saccharimonadales bacterium]|nr:hypothetical protein [Candidatus Saccharimonadales bacterium]